MRDGKRRVKKILVAGLCAVIFLMLLSLFYHDAAGYEVERMRESLSRDGHIIHAGGFMVTANGEQVTYTNSLEALENLYERGNRFCEIDLQETWDGMVICGHGDDRELVFGTGLPADASGEDFLSSRIYGEFTPMSLADLARFMLQHPDLTVITDVKTDNIRMCRRLSEEYPALRDHFIVQVQLPEEYDVIHRHELVSLIVPNGYYSPDAKLRLASEIIGVPIILHTLNDEWETSYYLNHNLALAVYTDRTDF